MFIALITIYVTTSTIYLSLKEDLHEDTWFAELITIVFFLITYIYSINLLMRSFIDKYYLKKRLNKMSQIFSVLFVILLVYLLVEGLQEKPILFGRATCSTLLIFSLIYLEIYYSRKSGVKDPSK